MSVYFVDVGSSDCTYVWTAVADRHILGGLYHPATTVRECQAACVNDTSCIGVDFNSNRQCYIIQAGLPGQGRPIVIGEDEDKHLLEENRCVHFELKRTCGPGEFTTCQSSFSYRLLFLISLLLNHLQLL